MKKSKLEKMILKSRLVKALYKAGYGHISIKGDKKELGHCEVVFSANGQTAVVGLDLSGVEDYNQAANVVIINIEPEIRALIPDLEYSWVDDELKKMEALA